MSLKMVLATMCMCWGSTGWSQFTNEFFQKNVAIVDATERSINEKEYVRQIRIRIFDGSQTPPVAMGNEEYGFLDDGKGNDLVAGDGIYTTVDVFNHSEANPFNQEIQEKSVLGAALVSPNFAHLDELKTFIIENPGPPKTEMDLEVVFECDVSWCSCSSKCGGCWVSWGARKGCVGCPKFTNCKFKIIWSPF